MNYYSVAAATLLVVDGLLRFGLAIRVIMRRRPVGVSLAWLVALFSFPVAGTLAYLLVGELRLGRRRVIYARAMHAPFAAWLAEVSRRGEAVRPEPGMPGEPIARIAEAVTEIPVLRGNAVELLDEPEEF